MCDSRYYNKAETNFGQDTAQGNMSRYGFQGIYQNYLSSETDRMKQDEMRRIQKLASGLVPGQASLRGGLASQGMGGATSNVIARQQREQGLGKALDEAGQQFESSSARLDSNLFAATQANEGMRFGASQDYMKAIGMGTQAVNQTNQANSQMRFGINSFNSQGNLQNDMSNSKGQFEAESSKKKNMFGFANQLLSIGGSLGGQALASYLKKPLPLGGMNGGGYDWSGQYNG